jgi:hypothetical protein
VQHWKEAARFVRQHHASRLGNVDMPLQRLPRPGQKLASTKTKAASFSAVTYIQRLNAQTTR